MSKLRNPAQRYITPNAKGGFNVQTKDKSTRHATTWDRAVKLRNKIWGHPALRYVHRKPRKTSKLQIAGLSDSRSLYTDVKGRRRIYRVIVAEVRTQQGKRKMRAWATQRRGRDAAIELARKWRREELKKMGIRAEV